MAKKQSRRSVSLSRSTYERLKTYCETSGISMSQFVEGRIGDFLGRSGGPPPAKIVAPPRPVSIPVPPPPVVAAPAPVVQAPVAAKPAPVPAPVVAAPAPAAAPVVARPAPAPVPTPVAAVPVPQRGTIPSAPNPGEKRPSATTQPAGPRKVDEAAARRAAERIFTF